MPTETVTLIRCPRCEESLPESSFGICRARPSGRNLYCARCIREKIALQRQRVRDMRRAQTAVERKPYTLAKVRPIYRMNVSAQDAVMLAIQRGADTQKKIKQATKLTSDEICDALAWNIEKLNREALRQRRYLAA